MSGLASINAKWLVRQTIVPIGGIAIVQAVQADPRRWSLAFSTETGTMRASPFPITTLVFTWTGWAVDGNPNNCTFKTPDWGAMVGMAWNVFNGGPASNIQVIEILWQD